MGHEKTEVLTIRVTQPMKEACARAADRAGVTFADWVRTTLFRAAEDAGTAPLQSRSRRRRPRKR